MKNKKRIEKDSLGSVEIPSDKYWGAQTQRSISNFSIGWENQPKSIIKAFRILLQVSPLLIRHYLSKQKQT